MRPTTRVFGYGCLCAAVLPLAGCQEVYRPTMTPLNAGLGANGAQLPTPVAMPAPLQPQMGSLWVPGSKQFFKDSRAHQVGDIVTVLVDENASAKTEAKTDAKRTNTTKSGILNLLNWDKSLVERGLPLGPTSLIDTDSDRNFKGDGKTNRKDSLTASIAAVVTQVLPNGLLVIQGQREVMVNYEKQMLVLQGMVRPEDISSQNTISSAKIAEARIAYNGRGTVDDVQAPQFGTRFMDKIVPF